MKNVFSKLFTLAVCIWGSINANPGLAIRNVMSRSAYTVLNKARPQLFIKRTLTGAEVAAAIATEEAVAAGVAAIITAYAAKAAAAGAATAKQTRIFQQEMSSYTYADPGSPIPPIETDTIAAAVIQKYVKEFIASEQAKAAAQKQQLHDAIVDTTVDTLQQSSEMSAEASAETIAPTTLNTLAPSDEKNKKIVDRSLLKLAVAALCVFSIVLLFSE